MTDLIGSGLGLRGGGGVCWLSRERGLSSTVVADRGGLLRRVARVTSRLLRSVTTSPCRLLVVVHLRRPGPSTDRPCHKMLRIEDSRTNMNCEFINSQYTFLSSW